jgi:putative sterol carrier protein
MPFDGVTDAQQILTEIFESSFAHEVLGAKLAATGLVVEFRFTEPDFTLIVDMGNRTVHSGSAPELHPSAVMAMSCATANTFWQGKLNLPIAMSKGQIKADGNVMSLIKLAPLTKKMYPVYTQNLETAGRHDLLAA